MAVTQYISKQGDRFDTLSNYAFGVVSGERISEIIELNPHLAVDAPIPAGSKVWLPIIETGTIDNTQLLPPWKR